MASQHVMGVCSVGMRGKAFFIVLHTLPRLTMTAAKASPSNLAYVHTKRLQMTQRDAAYEEKYGKPVDLEAELEKADRTSMPFEE